MNVQVHPTFARCETCVFWKRPEVNRADLEEKGYRACQRANEANTLFVAVDAQNNAAVLLTAPAFSCASWMLHSDMFALSL
jgi:hypothetical protein